MNNDPFRPVLRTQADVARFWTTICHPLGWSRHDLWFVVVDPDGRPLPMVQDVRDRPVAPDPEVVAGLVHVWSRLRAEVLPDCRFAALLCRPGQAAALPDDLAWAGAIAAEAAARAVPIEVTHLASDVAITPLPLDAVA